MRSWLSAIIWPRHPRIHAVRSQVVYFYDLKGDERRCNTTRISIPSLFKIQNFSVTRCIYAWNIECVRTVFLLYNQLYYERVSALSTRHSVRDSIFLHTRRITCRTRRVSLSIQASKVIAIARVYATHAVLVCQFEWVLIPTNKYVHQ